MQIIIEYLIVVVIAGALDAIYLGVIAKNFYQRQIGYLMSAHPNLAVAGLFYLVFAAGVMVFVLGPAFSQGYGIGRVILYGALLGLVIYGGYDFTNQAIVKDWPVVITIADLAWGICASALTSAVSYLIIKAPFK